MHSKYPEYINQRSLFRGGIAFTCMVSIIEKNIMGEKSAFKIFGKNSQKLEESMHLLWSDIFKDMKIKGMPSSYQDTLDFCYDKEKGPMNQDYFPGGDDDAAHFYTTLVDNLVEHNIPAPLKFLSPLLRNLFIVGMYKTTQIPVKQEKKIPGEVFYLFAMKMVLIAVSFKINYLPILRNPNYSFANLFSSEYQKKGISAVDHAGIGTNPDNKAYQEFKQSGSQTPWEGCPFHSPNEGH